MKKIFLCFSIVFLMLFITGCGRMLGTYSIIELTENGETYNLDVLNMVGLSYELIIQDEKNAIIQFTDEPIKLTYDSEKFIGKDEGTGKEIIIPYTRDNDKITITLDDAKMVFEKK